MTEEAQPSVPEKRATHKAATQKWMVGVLAGVFVVLLISLVFTILSNTSDKTAKVETKQAGTQSVENRDKTPTTTRSSSSSFFEQVDSKVAMSQRKAATGQPEHGADSTEQKPVTRMQAVQEEARRRSLRGANNDSASGNTQLSPEEQFARAERMRALQSRQARTKLDDSQVAAQQKPGNDIHTRVSRLARPINDERASIDQRKAEVQSRIEEARRLKSMLMNSKSPQADVEKMLTPSTGSPMFMKAANPAPVEPETVGFSKTNAAANNLDLSGKVLLPTATIINGVLAQTTMSDYPGVIKGLITHDVYDVNYEKILIPKGSEILIRSVGIANVNLPIQARMGLTVPWVILPNGKRIDFSRAAALDHMGIGAIKDEVDYHFLAQFLGVAAYAVLASSTADTNSSSQFTGQQNFEGDVGEAMRKQFAPLAARYLNLVPTITLNTGTPFKIIIEDDMYLEPWSTIYDNLITHN